MHARPAGRRNTATGTTKLTDSGRTSDPALLGGARRIRACVWRREPIAEGDRGVLRINGPGTRDPLEPVGENAEGENDFAATAQSASRVLYTEDGCTSACAAHLVQPGNFRFLDLFACEPAQPAAFGAKPEWIRKP